MEADPMVTLLGKSLVLPATPTKIRRLFLSCLDIFWQDIHYNRRVIFYRPNGQDVSTAIETLKTSLSLVLVHFYPWAGRLAIGEDKRLMIDCNDAGVEFLEASIDLPITALEKDDFQMKSLFEKLCQQVEYKNENLYTSPLLSVQATRFSDGGLSVALAQSHIVADGQSLWHFMRSWGECARGEALSLEPLHNREMLAVENPQPEKAVLKFVIDDEEDGDSEEKTMKSTTENGTVTESATVMDKSKNGEMTETENSTEQNQTAGNETNDATKPEPLMQRTFYMSGAAIKRLKREAAETTGRMFSSYEILCAHFWQRVTAARQQSASERANFAILANNRSRLTPPLPAAYFGNAISMTIVHAEAGIITEESIGATAARIHAAVVSLTEGRLRGLMHWLELHDNRLATEFKIDGSFMSVASSPRFPVYEVDFGWGRPAAVRSVKVPGNGEMVVFGGRPGSMTGDVEICMPLPSHVMQKLLHDPLFLASSESTTFSVSHSAHLTKLGG